MKILHDCRKAFARTLEELAESDSRIVAVVNDAVGSTHLGPFSGRFPSRFINVGIAEQNMIGVGAGLANGGKIPFVCGASCFLTGRALEQIKVDLGYSRSNVKICGMSGGLAYGELGPTHHSVEDLAWTRVIANLTVIVPADPLETAEAVRFAASHDGPVFLRLSRTGVPEVHDSDYQFHPGKAPVLRNGEDVALIAAGTVVWRALEAADLLAGDGVSARVINMSSLRPIDRDAVLDAAEVTGAIVTIEEHSIFGGLGSAVAEVTSADFPIPIKMLGVPGVFAPTGSTDWLFHHFGLTAERIREAALQLIDTRVKS